MYSSEETLWLKFFGCLRWAGRELGSRQEAYSEQHRLDLESTRFSCCSTAITLCLGLTATEQTPTSKNDFAANAVIHKLGTNQFRIPVSLSNKPGLVAWPFRHQVNQTTVYNLQWMQSKNVHPLISPNNFCIISWLSRVFPVYFHNFSPIPHFPFTNFLWSFIHYL